MVTWDADSRGGRAAESGTLASSARAAVSAHDPAGGPPIDAVRGDDQALVDAILAGDRDAFRIIVERESRTVIGACSRILGSMVEAEDVAQEAFVIAYRALGTYRGEGALGGWLTRIAVRLALRRSGQRREVTWIDPHADFASTAAGRSLRGGDPAVLHAAEERAGAVRSAVAGLPDSYREIVALRFFGDLSLKEIATTTGRPLGTVKTQLHRGLARLRDRLGPEFAS